MVKSGRRPYDSASELQIPKSGVLWSQEKQVRVEQIWLSRVADPTIVLRNCKFRRAG